MELKPLPSESDISFYRFKAAGFRYSMSSLYYKSFFLVSTYLTLHLAVILIFIPTEKS